MFLIYNRAVYNIFKLLFFYVINGLKAILRIRELIGLSKVKSNFKAF